MKTDMVVIGGGVAGLTGAAIASSYGVKTSLVEQMAPGGQIATVDCIRNFPAQPNGVAGFELGPMLQEQAEAAGVQFLMGTVNNIAPCEGGFSVHSTAGDMFARTVILATGSTRKELGVPGEAEFEGRGVSHCAGCDGIFYRGKTVVVAGGGDSAFDEAEVLAASASRVVIVHRGSRPLARQEAQARLARLANVEILADTEIVRLKGEQTVSAVELNRNGETVDQPCDGVFVYVGLRPNSGLIADLAELDGEGRVLVDQHMQTSTPGLFVAGDLRLGAVRTLSGVIGDGAVAAASAARFLGIALDG